MCLSIGSPNEKQIRGLRFDQAQAENTPVCSLSHRRCFSPDSNIINVGRVLLGYDLPGPGAALCHIDMSGLRSLYALASGCVVICLALL